MPDIDEREEDRSVGKVLGLLDEIVVHLVPILLGDGIRFYGRPGAERVDLERIGIGWSGQTTNLRFRVAKP